MLREKTNTVMNNRFRFWPEVNLEAKRLSFVRPQLCLILFMAFSSPVMAQNTAMGIAINTDENVGPDEIITEGTRRPTSEDELIYTVHTIGASELGKTMPRTLPESLTALPGVLVQKTASGHGSPYIRGFTGNRTLAVIDGIRYNNATYRDGANEYFSHIDSYTLEQVELLSGPASILYGSEAVGGTLSLTTQKSRFETQPGQNKFIDARQVLRYSSGDNSLSSRSEIDVGMAERWGLRAGISLKDYGNISAADLGVLPNTGYSETAWDARFDMSLSEAWNLTAAHFALSQEDVPRTHSTVFSVPFQGTTIGTDLLRNKDQNRSLSYIKLKGKPETDLANFVELTLSHQPRTEREYRIQDDGLDIRQSFSSDLWALNATLNSLISDNLDLTYGLDASIEDIDSQRRDFDPITQTVTNLVQGSVGDDARYQQLGVFATATWDVSDRFDAEAGLRGSYIRSEIGKFADLITGEPLGFNDDWNNLSGSLRAKYSLGFGSLWGALSRSFRAPNIADISRFGRSRTSEFEVASFGLEPETFDTIEIGYKYLNDQAKFSLAYYHTDMKGYIATVPTGRIVDGLIEVSKRNASSGFVRGIEAEGKVTVADGVSMTGNLTWLEGRLSEPTPNGTNITEPISRIQPLTGFIALDWARNEFWMRGELHLVDKADQLSSGDRLDTERIPPGGTPGYSLLNIRGGVSITPELELSLGFMNMFDTAYRSHGSGSNEAGRHILSGVTLSF